MKRDLTAFAQDVYDLLIIGGGIYGACVAWEASLRGLAVALVEKADFGSATSANSLKIIHGGLRYLQHADVKRMRESIREQRTLMRIAPHLVHPLSVVIPTYGHWWRGKEVLSLALMINNLVSFDRNRLDDGHKHLPRGRVISRREVRQLLPGIPQPGLTGGAMFYDAQVHNSERLLLSFLRSADMAGAKLTNYVEVIGLLRERDTVTGVEARDVLTGERFPLRAKMVVNTSGPWVERVRDFLNSQRPSHRVYFAKAINLVTRPLFPHKYALGIASTDKHWDRDAVVKKRPRLLFITPWRGYSLIGTAYAPYHGAPDDFTVTEQDIHDFLNDINQAYPAASLKRDEVCFVHGGLLPHAGFSRETDNVQLAKHSQIYDHRSEGVQGFLSVVGVKYTTARHVAEKVVDRVFAAWGYKPPRSLSSRTPLYGGQIERFEPFVHEAVRKRPYGLGEGVVRHLIANYGSAYLEVLSHLDGGDIDADPPLTEHCAVRRAEVLHGIREEMAQKLSDVVFRRSDLGTAGHPGHDTLEWCADIMRVELGWSPTTMQRELHEVNELFTSRC